MSSCCVVDEAPNPQAFTMPVHVAEHLWTTATTDPSLPAEPVGFLSGPTDSQPATPLIPRSQPGKGLQRRVFARFGEDEAPSPVTHVGSVNSTAASSTASPLAPAAPSSHSARDEPVTSTPTGRQRGDPTTSPATSPAATQATGGSKGSNEGSRRSSSSSATTARGHVSGERKDDGVSGNDSDKDDGDGGDGGGDGGESTAGTTGPLQSTPAEKGGSTRARTPQQDGSHGPEHALHFSDNDDDDGDDDDDDDGDGGDDGGSVDEKSQSSRLPGWDANSGEEEEVGDAVTTECTLYAHKVNNMIFLCIGAAGQSKEVSVWACVCVCGVCVWGVWACVCA